MVPETLEQNKPLSSTDSVGVFVCISIVITVFTFEASALEKKKTHNVSPLEQGRILKCPFPTLVVQN